MRVATWNINGLRARLGFVLRWLAARQPDLVGIQELKLTEEQFPHAELRAAGYHAAVFGQKAWNGVAILSRAPLQITETGLPEQAHLGARLLTARTSELSFTTLYGPNGKSVEHGDFAAKLAWLEALLGHFQASHHAEEPTFLCGDFNLCPTALDSWNEALLGGTIFHTEAERQRFQRLLEWGFHDLFREKHPGARAFSWWDYRGGAFHRGQGLRLDFLLASAGLAARVRAVTIDRDYRKKQEGLVPSDHAPVIADLE